MQKICKIQKELVSFDRKASSADGRDGRCKSCVSQYKKKQYRKKRNQLK